MDKHAQQVVKLICGQSEFFDDVAQGRAILLLGVDAVASTVACLAPRLSAMSRACGCLPPTAHLVVPDPCPQLAAAVHVIARRERRLRPDETRDRCSGFGSLEKRSDRGVSPRTS
jgi:hypothetical protein